MVNESSINVPQGIDLSKLNIAFELMWLNILFKEGCLNEEEYYKLKRNIQKKYL